MPCNILAIDGGGIRGIVPATIIQRIEKETGKKITDFFDVLAGTSTGGIIAAALAAGVNSSELVALYLGKAKTIFKQSFLDRLTGIDEYLEADYNNKGFKKELDRILGTISMKNVNESAAFGKKNKHLMVCSFDLNPEATTDGNRNYRPDVFYSSYLRDASKTLVDICLMTSAAPTYFPIYNDHIDGGVAMNNPSMAAVAFALNKQVSANAVYRLPDADNNGGFRKGLGLLSEEISLLSLGTGTSNRTFIPVEQTRKSNWGKLKWVNYLPDLLTESNVQSTHYYVDQVLPEKNYIRWNPCFDVDDAPWVLKSDAIKLDETDPLKLHAMSDFAAAYYQKNKAPLLKLIGA
ncbi:MAG: patatin-like phospholipase family protein [Chitinophagaceae bacterium]